ncbi:MAG: trehalose-phosphatase [Terriglobia bacterium]
MRAPAANLWPALTRRLARADTLALLSDFDGTLAPFAARPQTARLPDSTRRALARLARCPRLRLAIVSGRRLKELRRLVPVPNIWYVGSHGLEVYTPRGRYSVKASAAECRRMTGLRRRLGRRLRRLPGIWVEPKPASVSVHFRRAAPAAARQARAIVAEEWHRLNPFVRLQEGKKVWEFLPARDVSKAAAAARLLARWRGQTPARLGAAPQVSRRRLRALYLGDDQADELVFRRLGPAAISIHVGPGPTRARYRLGSPQAVGRFLSRLGEALGCA